VTAFASPDEASAHFAQAFQETASCVTDAVFNYPQTRPLGALYTLALAGGREVAIGDGYHLEASHQYVVTQDGDGYVVRTGAYLYTVNADRLCGELFGWHWHPASESWCQWPHLHAPDEDGDHVPTGRVAFEQVIRWLIEELNVSPLRHDWADVLDANELDWRGRRSWA
jgi:hypothetical protein